MPIEQFKNSEFLILKELCPDYVIPIPFIQTNNFELTNVLIVLYSQVHNEKYSNNIFYHSISYESSIDSDGILSKDFCSFLPSKALIFNVDEEKGKKITDIIKGTVLFKNNYSECL